MHILVLASDEPTRFDGDVAIVLSRQRDRDGTATMGNAALFRDKVLPSALEVMVVHGGPHRATAGTPPGTTAAVEPRWYPPGWQWGSLFAVLTKSMNFLQC